MKTCAKCGEKKSVSEFHKNAGRYDGLQVYCRTCTNIANAKWDAANPEKKKTNSAKSYAANADKVNARAASWQAANPEKQKASVAKWRGANPEAVRIHHQNRRARKREAGDKLSSGIAKKLFALQRGKCACGCGQHLGTDYHLDHRMPLALGGTNTDDNMQLLTATCNLKKGAKDPIDFMQQRGFLL